MPMGASTYVACFLVLAVLVSGNMKMWHITDVHYDWAYRTGGDIGKECHDKASNASQGAARIGEYRCDSSAVLVESAFNQMKAILPDPDFIIWTGDDPPHVKASELNTELVLEDMQNITNLVKSTFPSTPVYPILGNHDSFPPHQIEVGPNALLKATGKMWAHWLSDDAMETFLKGGYYTALIKPGLRLIALNTVYYYKLDLTTLIHPLDPAGQFDWLKSTLTAAKNSNERVIIAAHVPPGFCEKEVSAKNKNNNFHALFNDAYLRAFAGFGDTIVAHIYGHEHTDAIRLYQDEPNGESTGMMLLSPSVTPWYNPSYEKNMPANNPSLRWYEVMDSAPFNILGYEQWFTNLTADNANDTIEWEVEYTPQSAYGLPDLSLKSIINFAEDVLSKQDSIFQQYVFYNSVSYPQPDCEGECRATQLCSLQHAWLEPYKQCMTAA